MAESDQGPEEIVITLEKAGVSRGQGIADVIQQPGVSEDSLGGMCVDQLRRLEELERENERLRREVFELMLDKQMWTEMMRGSF